MLFVARMLIRLSCLIPALAALTLDAGHARGATPSPAERIVYLARDLSDENLIVLGASLAAWREDSILLLDSPRVSPYLKAFLTAYKPARVIPVAETHGPPATLWCSLFERSDEVIVCPAQPRGALLQAACLAGVLHAPLYVVHGRAGETEKLVKHLDEWRTRRVHLVGKADKLAERLTGVECISLSGEKAVALAYQKQSSRRGRIDTVVLANPADTREDLGSTSALAPWIAVRNRAALLLTNPEGDNIADLVERALRREALRRVEFLLITANLRAIPVWRRPNPIPGDKDQEIEMEPLTPSGNRPFTFAIGRLFHENRAVVLLMLARQRLTAERQGPRKALVASNSGNSLPLLETFSRNTIEGLRDAGYETTTLLGRQVNSAEVRRLMPLQDLFLWEGHSGTLMNDYEFPTWDDPLPGTFVFLQSCLSLTEPRVGSLLNRGAGAVIGSSTRTYSGSGGACSLSFFNALLYEDQPVGAALRQAKNFLLAYSLLKEKRLGKSATRTGANVRSAWAFTLWGDPTFKLPRPERSASDTPHPPFVRHEVQGNTIVLSLPKQAEKLVRTDKYQVALPPNGRFGGLVKKEKVDDRRPLVPLVFAEVHLPRARPGRTPQLSSRLPSSRWVFCWDERRRRGYLLAMPRPEDTEELRFHVRWESVEARNSTPASTGGGQ